MCQQRFHMYKPTRIRTRQPNYHPYSIENQGGTSKKCLHPIEILAFDLQLEVVESDWCASNKSFTKSNPRLEFRVLVPMTERRRRAIKERQLVYSISEVCKTTRCFISVFQEWMRTYIYQSSISSSSLSTEVSSSNSS